MKKTIAILTSLISINAFATEGITIISEEHVRTPGVSHVSPVTFEVGKISDSEIKYGIKAFGIDSLSAKTKNSSGGINKATGVWANQATCLSNKTSFLLQYGYRFDLIVGKDNALDARTFFLDPGYYICPKREGFNNFTMRAPGNYTITAITRAAEGSTLREVSDKAVLSIR